MNDLLQQNERRKLRLAEILIRRGDWVKLKELTEELECSERILKYDLKSFKDNLTDFKIESSHHGIRLIFSKNKGFKNIYENIYENSHIFQLLELLFFDETLSIDDIAEQLFISSSTLYRVINHANQVVQQYNFQIATNPCKIVGDEENIRCFYYQFFFEKYSILTWPYNGQNDKMIEDLLYFFMTLTDFEADFAYYNIARLILLVNLARYQKGHFVHNEQNVVDIDTLLVDTAISNQEIEYFKNEFNLDINENFAAEVMSPFLQSGYSFSYEHLMKKTQHTPQTLKEVEALENLIVEIAQENKISLSNKENLTLKLYNIIHLENCDPRSGCILYNRNQLFTEGLQKYFPVFYDSIHQKIVAYRKQHGLNTNQRAVNYMIYTLFVEWENLFVELRQNFHKIKILIISNRTSAHSWMLKNFLDAEFKDYTISQIYNDTIISIDILKKLDYDLIIANFPIPELETKEIIYIENFPTRNELKEVYDTINRIYANLYSPFNNSS